MKISVSHVNAHKKVTSAEKDFSNQVGGLTHPMDTNWPLFPATPVVSQGAHEPSGRGGYVTP